MLDAMSVAVKPATFANSITPPFRDLPDGAEPTDNGLDGPNAAATMAIPATANNDTAFRGSQAETQRATAATGEANTEAPFHALFDEALDPAETPPESPEALGVIVRPCYRVYDDWWQKDGRQHRPGVYYHGSKPGKGDAPPSEFDLFVCSPLHVDAESCDERCNHFGLLLRFRNRRGLWRQWLMPMVMLKGNCDELRGELLSMGLEIDHHHRNYLPAFLQSQHPQKRLECALSVGWHHGVFVLPDRVIGDRDDVFFQDDHAQHADYGQRGTLEEWQQNVARYCPGNPLLLFAVSVAFAGPLLALCHISGGGFHPFGDSSKGKSTGQKLAASVWGGETFGKSWRATANGLEGAFMLHSDSLLPLDEFGEGDPREIEATLYAIGNGVGKQRANVKGGARRVNRWRIMVLSNGEKTIEAKLAEKGLTAKAGQLVRLLQFPIFGQYGAFDELHDMESSRALSDYLQSQAAKYYGTAGIAYLERLVRDKRDMGELLERMLQAITADVDGLQSQELRGARLFALAAMAGELATEYGVTPWPEGAAIQAAKDCFDAWRNHRGTGNTETRQILTAVADFIDRHGDSRFSALLSRQPEHDNDARVINRAGWWRDPSEGEREYLFTETGLKEAATCFEKDKITAVLSAAGWLKRGKDGKPRTQVKVSGRNQSLYVVTVNEASHGH